MKKIYSALIIICLMTIVSAGVISLSKLEAVTFKPKQIAEVSEQELISYKCDGIPIVSNKTEPDGKWDDNDVRSATQCEGTVTEIVKGGLTYKQNKYGTKSFNETYLKNDECSKDGNHVWNDGICNEIIEEVDCTNHLRFWYDDICNDKEQIFEEPKEFEF